MFEKRTEFIYWLNSIENRYQVHEMKILDLDIWPVLRYALFYNFLKTQKAEEETKNIGPKRTSLKIKIKTGFHILKGGYSYLRLKLNLISKSQVLFSGAESHRVWYDERYINRYFHPISNILIKKGVDVNFADYSINPSAKYDADPKRFPIYSVYLFYNKIGKELNLKNEFRKLNEADEIIKELQSKFKIDFNTFEFLTHLGQIFKWAEIYEKFLRASSIKLCFGLCYYNAPMYGLNLACYRLGIPSVDVQHGTQGRLHAAYSGFLKVPDNGFSSLPKIFWTWDKSSFQNLDKIFLNSSDHEVIKGGNPWISFLSSQKVNLKMPEKKIILFTLQPLEPIVPDIILKAIKNTPVNYMWWIRFHPRMSRHQIEEVKAILGRPDYVGKVNIDEPNKFNLPALLNLSDIHISKFSGSIIEASIMGTPNIIIDPIGLSSFGDLIDGVNNIYHPEGDLWPIIKGIKGKNNLEGNSKLEEAIFNLTRKVF